VEGHLDVEQGEWLRGSCGAKFVIQDEWLSGSFGEII